jgi:hypothetical protein
MDILNHIPHYGVEYPAYHGSMFLDMLYKYRLHEEDLATVLEISFDSRNPELRLQIGISETGQIKDPLPHTYITSRLYSGQVVYMAIFVHMYQQCTESGCEIAYMGNSIQLSHPTQEDTHIVSVLIEHAKKRVWVIDIVPTHHSLELAQRCLSPYLHEYVYQLLGTGFMRVLRSMASENHGICVPTTGFVTYLYLKGFPFELSEDAYRSWDLYKLLSDDWFSVCRRYYLPTERWNVLDRRIQMRIEANFWNAIHVPSHIPGCIYYDPRTGWIGLVEATTIKEFS